MDDRIPLPLLFERGDCQSVEELLLSLEICLECADEQAFAEPARPAEEIVPSRCDQLVHKGSLVHIEEPVLSQALEILYAYRIKFSHNTKIISHKISDLLGKSISVIHILSAVNRIHFMDTFEKM